MSNYELSAIDQVLGIIDYDKLPLPQVIEDVQYQDILKEMVDMFREKAPEYKNLLESDPIMKVIETYAYREMILRKRINDAARANMLPFATGADLDMLGAFYEVARILLQEEDTSKVPPIPAVWEEDTSYRDRIRDRIRGWSTAGGEYHYRFWARNGIPDVADVAVDSPEGGKVRISVLSRDDDGMPSDELIERVREQVNRPDVIMLTDTVEVIKPTPIITDVGAIITLRRDTPTRIYDEVVAGFETSFKELRRLGRDVTRGWLFDTLFVDGVYNVELTGPEGVIGVGTHEYPLLGNVDLQYGGRRE